MAKELIEFREDTHQYFVNGQEFPGVTRILQSVGLGIDYSKVDPATLQWKRDFGTALHRAIELDLNNDLNDYDPRLQPYLDSWRQLRDTMKIQPIATELAIYSARYGYCGTLDLLAEYGHRIGIFDYKSSSQIELISVGAQQAGYEIAYREWDEVPDNVKIDLFAIKFDKNGKCRLIPLEDPMDKTTFLYAVSLYNRKKLQKYV